MNYVLEYKTMLRIFRRKKTNGQKSKKSIKGHLDEYDGRTLRGWACSKKDDASINLALYINDQEYTSLSPNQFRQDLRDAGIRNGYAAFSEAVDIQDIRNEFGHNAVLRIIDKDSGEELVNSPKILKEPKLQWKIDTYSNNEFSGWVVDINNDSLQMKLNVFIDDEYAGDVSTNLERAELESIGIENVNHGFHINFHDFSKGKYQFRVRIEVDYGGTHLLGEEKEVVSFQVQLKGLTDLQHFLREQNYDKQSKERNNLVKGILPALIDACRKQRHVPISQILSSHNTDAETKAEIAVIVPVYKGLDETLDCLNSVLNSQNKQPYRLIAIYDCGPEAEMLPSLQALSKQSCLELHENLTNLGFVGTVNRGMKLAVNHDVILLNSDTLVADGWLDAIAEAAYSSANVATVTPISNNATICSFPNFCQDNELPTGHNVNTLAGLCSSNTSQPVELPTAHGYCMFINRHAINEVGYFDEETWGKGYGEENDFSLRATKLGWKHLATNKTFVHHLGSVSFAGDAPELMKKNQKILNNLYPDYPALVASFIERDPMSSLRNELTEKIFLHELESASISSDAKGKSILFVSISFGGGTKKATDDLAKMLIKEGQSVFLLSTIDNVTWTVTSYKTGLSKQFDINKDDSSLYACLEKLDIWKIHYHHWLEFDDKVWSLPQKLNCGYRVTLHDYYSICPRVEFISFENKYCESDKLRDCNLCIKELGFYPASFMKAKDFDYSIDSWRKRSLEKLSQAEKVITPSMDTKSRIERYIPLKNIECIPHNEEETVYKINKVAKADGEQINIGFLGAIGIQKGVNVIKGLAKEIHDSQLDIIITIIGSTADDDYFKKYKFVTVTGLYAQEDLTELLLKSNIDAVFLSSITPETFGYTYSEVLSRNIPVIAFNHGAIVERAKESSTLLIEPASSTTEILTQIHNFLLSDINTSGISGQSYSSVLKRYYS